MSDLNQEAAVKALGDVASALGLKLSPAELELAGDLLVGVVQAIGGAAQKRATAAAVAAAAAVTTVEQANAVMEAAAAAQVKP